MKGDSNVSSSKHAAQSAEEGMATVFGRRISKRLLAIIGALLAVAVVAGVSTAVVTIMNSGETNPSTLVRQADPDADGKPLKGATADTTGKSADGKNATSQPGSDESGADFNDLVNGSSQSTDQSDKSGNAGKSDEADNTSDSKGLTDKVQDQPQDDSSFGDIH